MFTFTGGKHPCLLSLVGNIHWQWYIEEYVFALFSRHFLAGDFI
jgi:hypothetical protein